MESPPGLDLGCWRAGRHRGATAVVCPGLRYRRAAVLIGTVFQRFNLFRHDCRRQRLEAPVGVKGLPSGGPGVAGYGGNGGPNFIRRSCPAPAAASRQRPRAGDEAGLMPFDEPTFGPDPNCRRGARRHADARGGHHHDCCHHRDGLRQKCRSGGLHGLGVGRQGSPNDVPPNHGGSTQGLLTG